MREEICDPGRRFGEGLQADLVRRAEQGRLLGILNGCEYPARLPEPLSYPSFWSWRGEVLRWIGDERTCARRTCWPSSISMRSWRAGAAARVAAADRRRAADRSEARAARRHHGRWAHGPRTPAGQLHADERLLVLGNGQPEMEALLTRLQASDRACCSSAVYSEACRRSCMPPATCS
jgi:starch synthase